jgi:hypothetical protein
MGANDGSSAGNHSGCSSGLTPYGCIPQHKVNTVNTALFDDPQYPKVDSNGKLSDAAHNQRPGKKVKAIYVDYSNPFPIIRQCHR